MIWWQPSAIRMGSTLCSSDHQLCTWSPEDHWSETRMSSLARNGLSIIDGECVGKAIVCREDLRFDSSPDNRQWLSSASIDCSLDVRQESHNRQMSPDSASKATLATKRRLSRWSASHRWPDYDLSSGRKARALDSITTVVIDSQTMDDIWYSLSSRTSSQMTRLWPVLCPTGYAPVVDTTAVIESTTLSPTLKVPMLLVSKQVLHLFLTSWSSKRVNIYSDISSIRSSMMTLTHISYILDSTLQINSKPISDTFSTIFYRPPIGWCLLWPNLYHYNITSNTTHSFPSPSLKEDVVIDKS